MPPDFLFSIYGLCSRSHHVNAYRSRSFKITIHERNHILLIHSPPDWHLGCFQFFTIISSTSLCGCCPRHGKVGGRWGSRVNRSRQVPCWGLFQPSDGPWLFAPSPFSQDGPGPAEAQDAFLVSGGASCLDPVTLWLSQTRHREPRDLGYLGRLTYTSARVCAHTRTHTPSLGLSVPVRDFQA